MAWKFLPADNGVQCLMDERGHLANVRVVREGAGDETLAAILAADERAERLADAVRPLIAAAADAVGSLRPTDPSRARLAIALRDASEACEAASVARREGGL